MVIPPHCKESTSEFNGEDFSSPASVWEVQGSSLNRENIYLDWGVSWFLSVPAGKCLVSVPKFRPRTPTNTHFSVHDSLLILLIDTIKPQLLKTSLNKPQINKQINTGTFDQECTAPRTWWYSDFLPPTTYLMWPLHNGQKWTHNVGVVSVHAFRLQNYWPNFDESLRWGSTTKLQTKFYFGLFALTFPTFSQNVNQFLIENRRLYRQFLP
jgi:hypothetical protein